MSDAVHVVPIADLVQHEVEGDDCVCVPDVEFLEDGGKLVVHHSLDGRELSESDRAAA